MKQNSKKQYRNRRLNNPLIKFSRPFAIPQQNILIRPKLKKQRYTASKQ